MTFLFGEFEEGFFVDFFLCMRFGSTLLITKFGIKTKAG